ncbi:MAG: threonine/serine exporter family protein [Tannerellaceae bacterium]|nr:threonine/serine exporter family protein [Tannerellaceae bacterium]
MQENEQPSVKEIASFLSGYAALLMGSGVHTSRVIRNSGRIAESQGVILKASVFHKNIILTVHRKDCPETYVEVVDIPVLPISFEYNSELSALSWEAYDKHLSLGVLREKYNQIIESPRINPLFVLLMVGFANASFCQLFGGDWLSTVIVFSATLVGFFLKSQMQARHLNHYIIFITSAFVASACAATSLIFETTSEIALTTSVLFLIPGVPLINGVIDIVEGYILTGFARLTHAMLLVICIAIGLSFTLWMVKDNLI